MVKNDNKRYLVYGQQADHKDLYRSASLVEGKLRNISSLIHTEIIPGIPVVVVFVRHRSKKND
ncbi:hypothetical protein ASF12_01575 [Paenibacillus sp. Leaf72]|nr:hypothetical protein ASF12_01575 [Paenibacillus sp. Leaf72]